jgi:hypothetical protein
MKLRLTVAASALAFVLAGATPAFAGESTGNFWRTGTTTPIADYVMHSICAFSGQNPEVFLPPTDPHYEPGRTQSWGQIPKEVRDSFPDEEHPGNACNGHTGFLAGGGSE